MPANRHIGSPSGTANQEVDRRALRDGNNRQRAGQEVKAVVGEPDAEAERDQRSTRIAPRRPAERSGCGRRQATRDGRRQPTSERPARRPARSGRDAEHQAPPTRPHDARQPLLELRTPARPSRTRSADRRRRTGPPARQCRAGRSAGRCRSALDLQHSAPGTRTASATLSCGQACTQSRQNVQSRLPTLAG